VEPASGPVVVRVVSWLGAAMARTRLPFGVVNAPGQRYHPAIVAEAAATLADMFPDRL
jgi:coenzyme F420-dependent glucose-6-phosphate dehydrogenase